MLSKIRFRILMLCVCLCGVLSEAAAQCPAKTTVSDTLYNADGSLVAGRVMVAWPTFRIGSCQVIAGQVSVTISGGVLSVQLYPNDTATPAGTSYRVTYYLKSGQITTEYWVVPTSASPLTLATVRSTSVPVPAVMVSQAQVTNLVSALAKKLELPSACTAGKFLQSNGSPSQPQVNCVDGTGAPLASSTQSGTVKTDTDEADPRVYTRATTDTLLAAKASATHTHAAADTISGVFDPALLPTPSTTSLGGVKGGSCAGTDKVTGISTSGVIACGPDESGASSQHQVNSVNLASNDPVNFQDTPTIAFSNPAAGNVQAAVKDSSINAAKLAVANPSAAQLSGVGDANVTEGALSPNRIAGTAEVQANRGAANGYAALDASSLVVQDPANATASPTAFKIVKALGTGKIDDGWLSALVSLLGQSIEDGELASNYSGVGYCTNQFVRTLNDNAAPTCATVGASDIAISSPTSGQLSGVSSTNLVAPNKTLQITYTFFDTGTDLPNTLDIPSIWANRSRAIHITEVWCEIDAGSVSINLQRDDSTPANILTADLACSTSGASTTSFVSGEDGVAVGQNIDHVTVSVGTGQRRLNVVIKYTVD